MAVKYVKDFAYDPGFGFTGSTGGTTVRAYMRGGAVKKAAEKAPALAPAMVEQRSKGLGGLTSETKKLAAYNKPHKESKKGPSVPAYAHGGSVKKPKMMKKADGGVIGIAEDPNYDERMERLRRKGDDAFRAADLADRLSGMTREGMGESRGNPDMEVGISPIERASPLASVAAARRAAMRPDADMMRRAAEVTRGKLPAPRRAMPVAPKAPMIDRARMLMSRRGMRVAPQPLMRADGGKVSKGEKKIGKVMGEFKRGELHSGSKEGPLVTSPKQAKAIALSEARAAGAKIPKKAMGGKACG